LSIRKYLIQSPLDGQPELCADVPHDQRLDPKAKVAFTIEVGEKRKKKDNALDPLRRLKVRPKGSKMPPMYKIINHTRSDGTISEQKVLMK